MCSWTSPLGRRPGGVADRSPPRSRVHALDVCTNRRNWTKNKAVPRTSLVSPLLPFSRGAVPDSVCVCSAPYLPLTDARRRHRRRSRSLKFFFVFPLLLFHSSCVDSSTNGRAAHAKWPSFCIDLALRKHCSCAVESWESRTTRIRWGHESRQKTPTGMRAAASTEALHLYRSRNSVYRVVDVTAASWKRGKAVGASIVCSGSQAYALDAGCAPIVVDRERIPMLAIAFYSYAYARVSSDGGVRPDGGRRTSVVGKTTDGEKILACFFGGNVFAPPCGATVRTGGTRKLKPAFKLAKEGLGEMEYHFFLFA